MSSAVTSKAVKGFPIGVSNYRELISENYYFIDKTLSIKQVFNESKVVVLPRPRRFGKTLFMSMLQYFLSDKIENKSTSPLFQNNLIAQHEPEFCKQHQGQYSVIFVTLKEVKSENYDLAMEHIADILSRLYHNFYALIECDKFTDEQKAAFKRIAGKCASQAEYSNALLELSSYLKIAYNKPVVILIDEYDTPIQAAYLNDYYKPLISFMRGFLGASLKDNNALYKGVITGITRVAKESLFSDLNNVSIYTIFDKEFNDSFGFTEQEVNQLLSQTGCQQSHEQIKKWYNGYQIRSATVYNPWSIINCLKRNGELGPYWVNTSDNKLIQHLLARSTSTVKVQLEHLINGDTIECEVDVFTHFEKLLSTDESIWNLLLTTGYLTATDVHLQGFTNTCQLKIPNYEILLLYQSVIRGWFSETIGTQNYDELLDALLCADMELFKTELQDYLLNSASYFDSSGRYPEKFYHGLILGMMLTLRNTHSILSNRESGLGRYDIMVIPKDINAYPYAVIMEFKRTRNPNDDLQQVAEQALQQIQQKSYQQDLIARGMSKQLLVGLAFRGKQMELVYTTNFK